MATRTLFNRTNKHAKLTSQSSITVTPPLSLRTATYFVKLPKADNPNYLQIAERELVQKGKRAIEAARCATPSGISLATVRLVPPLLDERLSFASSQSEAEEIAHEEFLIRETVADQLNRYVLEVFQYEREAPEVFLGGYGVSAHVVSKFGLRGFLSALISDLPTSRWQFSLVMLGDAKIGIQESAVTEVAAAVTALRRGGARFAAMFGEATHTPFFPCAQHSDKAEGISIGMSCPGAHRDAIRLRKSAETIEDVIARTQRDALRRAAVVGLAMASHMRTRFFGCDPSQAPVFDADSPGANSIGAVIEDCSHVPLGAPGTKDGFFRLMAALHKGGVESGVPLCGFVNGSFLPVAEDDRIAARVAEGRLTYSGILSLCHVCAAGLDMVVVEPETSQEMIARVLRDIAVTHLLKGKALAARIIVPEVGTPTDEKGYYVFGGLLGRAPALPLDPESR